MEAEAETLHIGVDHYVYLGQETYNLLMNLKKILNTSFYFFQLRKCYITVCTYNLFIL